MTDEFNPHDTQKIPLGLAAAALMRLWDALQ